MAYTPGDWLDGRQFDEDGRAIAFDPTQLNTINGVKQQASFGPYFQKLLDSGVISKDRMLTGSDNYGGAGQQWFPGNDGNIYLVDGSGKRPITRIPASNIDPRTGKDKVGSISEFLDPNTGAVTGTGAADFGKMDPGAMISLAMIAAMTGGAALTGMGVIGGGAAATGGAGGAGGAVGGAGGAVGGAGGFIGEGAASGIGAWDGALAAAPSWAAPAAGTAAMGAGAEGLGGGSGAVFNPAVDSQLASTQLGITGSQAAADAAAAGIPSVTSSALPEAVQSALTSSGVTAAQVAASPSLMQQLASTLGMSPAALTSLIGPAVSAIGGALSASATKDAANSAASSQMQAAQLGIDEWKRQFDTVRGLLNPYVQAGTQAVGAQGDLAGINGADKQQAAITNLQTMPAFTSQLKLGENRILQNASATGGLRGGNTEGALAYFAPSLLASTINDQYTRLGGLTSIGANAAAGVGNAGMTTTQGITGLQQQGGAAQAGAAIAGGAAQQRLYGGLSTALGQYFGYGGGVPGMTGTAAAPAAGGVVPPNPFL